MKLSRKWDSARFRPHENSQREAKTREAKAREAKAREAQDSKFGIVSAFK
jgi:hypothetical protein